MKCKNDFYVFMREVEMACKQIIPMAMANRGNAKQISETITSKEAVYHTLVKGEVCVCVTGAVLSLV